LKNSKTEQLVIIAFFIALDVILTRFCSINTDILRIGFGFLPAAMVGIMYGPLWAGISYAIADVLGMMIFPSGAYFPGFTFTAFLTGLVYGLFLYKKELLTWKKILIPVLIVCMGINLFVDTLWLEILYGQGYLAIFPLRVIKCAVMVPIQTILIKIIWEKVIIRIKTGRQ